jgi:WD repeat-containing protein mio
LWLYTQGVIGAENLAKEEGMIFKGLDLRYVGVCNIWNNDIGMSKFSLLLSFLTFSGNKSQSRLIDAAGTLNSAEWAHVLEDINKRAYRLQFDGTKTNKPHHRLLSLAICGWGKSGLDLDKALKDLEEQGQFTKAAAWALYENVPQRAVEILRRGGKDLLFIGLALNLHLKGAEALDKNDWDKVLQEHPEMMADPYLRAIYALISTNDWKAIADETALPLRDRVGVAVRHLNDLELTSWLEKQMIEAIETGDIEGIVLTGITDKMVDILAKYIEKFGDYQTAALIMSNAAPLYIDDYRCSQWREEYRDFLNTNKLHIDRCKFDVQSTKKSRQRDGITVIKPPPRQVTLRCVRCDTALTNDLANTANPPASTTSGTVSADRSPLYSIGVHAGISCPKCGRHLGRCAVCLQTLGMPRTDRPELSTEKQALLANFMTFCLKCDHACHADHSGVWFARHNECPAPDCRCPCNQQDIKINAEYEVRKGVNGLE